jgi:hypothetical protein
MKKFFLIVLGVFGLGFGVVESVQADPVHIGFAFFSPVALCPPVYIGPTFYTREPRTYYSPYLIMVSGPYQYHGRFGYFDYFYHWHDVARWRDPSVELAAKNPLAVSALAPRG